MLKFLEMFRRSRVFESDSPEKTAFQNKYRHFQNLLAGNNRALEIMTELEQVCYGPKPFGIEYITGQTERLVSRVYDIAEDLNALSGGHYEGLFDAVELIGVEILQELVRKKRVEKTSLTVPLQHLSLERASEVGGKAASLGEITNRVHLPVPRGFAISAYACYYFMESNRLFEQAERILKGLNIDDTENLVASSRAIHSLILHAPLPPDLEASLMEQMDRIVNELGPDVQMAMRSSATSEDSEASFAGQHSSFLGVTRGRVVEAYKRVVASTFNPRAIYYRRSKGYPDDHVIMSALCIEMVDAKSAGVMYTRDPNDNRRDVVMVNAVWGLGVGAVSGSTAADYYEVEKEARVATAIKTAHKATRIALDGQKALIEVGVPEAMQDQACLTGDQLSELVRYGLALEEHYRVPLDIEWALDARDRLVLLQARPLNLDLTTIRKDEGDTDKDVNALKAEFPDHPVMLKGGMTASRGKASGLAYVLTSDHNLLNIPEGSILIAPQTSPRYVAILGRVQAIVTDVGSVTGHMASVAREFSIPTLVGTGNATRVIPHGAEITLDATNGVVFEGRVESILERKKPVNPMKGSPAYKKAHSVLKKIAVLNLVDPKREDFSPEGCSTLHDVIRFAHEMSMQEMFSISDDLEVSERFAVRIKVPLPMKIYAVDLGGGLQIAPHVDEARMEDVQSIPFRAILRGMTHPGVQWLGAVGIDWKGFASIVTESIFSDPTMDDRMGGPNYVVVSKEYLNFNSRLGYHFAVVDAYCGPQVNDNYITFSFKGGAADIGRRSRRAALIAQILKRLDLKTEIRGDMVRGEIKKYDSPLMEEKLDMIGRLLGAVRLLDMVLSDDGHIDWYVEEFFKGNYTFQRVA
ncbi:MAG: pyruvate, phosphate dikinase [Syntrophobacteraceae bacterium]|nr:pyruvate, phosphate dikinase [Syntrophobacteraceae bacterium]